MLLRQSSKAWSLALSAATVLKSPRLSPAASSAASTVGCRPEPKAPIETRMPRSEARPSPKPVALVTMLKASGARASIERVLRSAPSRANGPSPRTA